MTISPTSSPSPLAQIVSLLHPSRTSEEKFVALALLPRVLDPDDVTAVESVFCAVDWDFVQRLLISDGAGEDGGGGAAEARAGVSQGDDGVEEIPTKLVAVQIVSSFADYPTIVVRQEMVSLGRALAESVDAADDPTLNQLTLDTVGKIVSASVAGWRAATGLTAVEALTTLLAQSPRVACHTSTRVLLVHLITHAPPSLRPRHRTSFTSSLSSILATLAPVFRDAQDSRKLESLHILDAAVGWFARAGDTAPSAQTAPAFEPPATTAHLPALTSGLADLLSSKRVPHTLPLLSLSSYLASLHGPSFLLAPGPGTHGARKLTPVQFLVVLTHAACTEVRVGLDDLPEGWEAVGAWGEGGGGGDEDGVGGSESAGDGSGVDTVDADKALSVSKQNRPGPQTPPKPVPALTTLPAALSLIESVIRALSTLSTDQTTSTERPVTVPSVEVLASVRNAMGETMLAVGSFLAECMHRTPTSATHPTPLAHPLAHIAARTICTYLAEESSPPPSLPLGVVEPTVAIAKLALSTSTSSTSTSSTSSSTSTTSTPQEATDLLASLFPAWSQLTSGETSDAADVRAGFVSAGAGGVVCDALAWVVRVSDTSSTSHGTTGAAWPITTGAWILPALETLTNLVVTTPTLVSSSSSSSSSLPTGPPTCWTAFALGTLIPLALHYFPHSLTTTRDVLLVIHSISLSVLILRSVALSPTTRVPATLKTADVTRLDTVLDVFAALPRMKPQLGEQGWTQSGVGEVWELGVSALGDLARASARVADRLVKLPRKTVRLLELVRDPTPLDPSEVPSLRALFTALLLHDRIRGRDICVQALGGQWNVKRLVELGWTEAMAAMQEAEERVLRSVGFDID
ncbi:hypothetical protein M427DRAFT_69946, partial [Gonapodya prolifera JEL478]